MHGLPIHTCCRTLLQCLRYYCLPQAGLLLTNLHLLTQTVASFTNLFCCLTPLSIFFVNLNLIVTHVAVSWWGSIFFFFLLYADAQMQNFAARLCIVCTFAFFVTRWCKVVYVLQIYICLQTLSPVVRNITNIHYQNHVLFVIINWICSKSKEKKVEREYTTPNWILLDFRKKWKSTRFFVGVHWILEPSWGGWSTWFFPFQFYFSTISLGYLLKL